MPDFNNGPGNDLNSRRSLNPERLFESDSNNGPPQAIPMLNCKHKQEALSSISSVGQWAYRARNDENPQAY